jgi:hypothetical protein
VQARCGERDMSKSIENNKVVYVCKYQGDIMYIGMGEQGRQHHLTSGISNVYEANIYHFLGWELDVEVIAKGLEREYAKQMEHGLINEHRPPWNVLGLEDRRLFRNEMRSFFYKRKFESWAACICKLYLTHSSGHTIFINKKFLEKKYGSRLASFYNTGSLLRKENYHKRKCADRSGMVAENKGIFMLTPSQYLLDNYRDLILKKYDNLTDNQRVLQHEMDSEH